MNNEQCGLEQSDLKITRIKPNSVKASKGFQGRDDSNVLGIKIDERCEESTNVQICFDATQVGGLQSTGFIGFNRGGIGYQCPVENTLPDFCGGQLPKNKAPKA